MKTISEKEQAALVILRTTGCDVLEAALLAKEALAAGRGQLSRAKKCIAAGAEELKKREKTVSFERAVKEALEARKNRRLRTQTDFRYFTQRFMKRCKGLAKRRVRAITTSECTHYIETAFQTPRQRQKARLILSGVFATAIRCSWCSENPVARVVPPQVEEKPLTILTPEEAEQLVKTAREYRGGICLPAVSLMLYAGIRPHEVARLRWSAVDDEYRRVLVQPKHSKTGGARAVTIYPKLQHILKSLPAHSGTQRICPPQWVRHWQELRRQAGWNQVSHPWLQDVCRHSFASYHAAYFRNLPELQLEMGHRDSTLLRTRYLSAVGQNAESYWKVKQN